MPKTSYSDLPKTTRSHFFLPPTGNRYHTYRTRSPVRGRTLVHLHDSSSISLYRHHTPVSYPFMVIVSTSRVLLSWPSSTGPCHSLTVVPSSVGTPDRERVTCRSGPDPDPGRTHLWKRGGVPPKITGSGTKMVGQETNKSKMVR